MHYTGMIRKYLPAIKTIGGFARVTDVAMKTDEELADLYRAGFDGLTIGMEAADDEALRFVDKGYLSADILEQCGRLDRVGIRYSFFYLTGISGAGRGELPTRSRCGANFRRTKEGCWPFWMTSSKMQARKNCGVTE